MAEPNTGMSKAEMKKMLRRSFGEGMGCAVGIGDNPAMGLFMMHRIRRGKALEKLLKDEFPDAKNVRFGTAFVNEDEPKKVQLSLNRALPGIARKLVKTLKGTGFTKVVIASDDGMVDDFEEQDETPEIADDADAPVASAAPQPRPVEAPVRPDVPAPTAGSLGARLSSLVSALNKLPAGPQKGALTKLAMDAGARIKGEQFDAAVELMDQLEREMAVPTPASAPAPTAGSLGNRLSSLVSALNKLPAGPQKAALTKLAMDAGASIKGEQFDTAVTRLDQLEREMAAGQQPAAAPAPTAGSLGGRLSSLVSELNKLPAGPQKAALTKLAMDAGARIKGEQFDAAASLLAKLKADLQAPVSASGAADGLAKVRIDWSGVRDGIAADVGTLAKALADSYAGQSFAKEITDRFKAKADPLLARLDGRLGLAIDRVVNATDAADRAQATQAARAVLGDFQALTDDPFLADLDANPFVPLTIRSKTAAALAAVAAAL